MSRRGTNIRKRADGRWEGRYYIVDTAGSKKCKSVYAHSYKEVTERLLTAKAASLNQTHTRTGKTVRWCRNYTCSSWECERDERIGTETKKYKI